ncbi:hypothetical protein VaNZ11_004826 [Volvox africanus]|uniref:Peptidase S9A N-terminal domain-containing protein n=1 Tax=Volvox africanus TaxID=51714 RepID=A0ABQ5RXS0_9CHLO|nr:hypothetical protein VaNZ11_004826 [Volvox africanus]
MKREGPHPLAAESAQHVRWAVHASRTGQASQRPQIPPPNPQPSSQPNVLQLHGEQPRLDPFHWLQAGHRNPEVLRYLQQENEYSKLQLRNISTLRNVIAQEIAELSWRQAVMLAAQAPFQAPIDTPRRYGGFEYRRVAVRSDTTTANFRHFRFPCRRSDTTKREILPQQHKQRQERMPTQEQEQQVQMQMQQHDPQGGPDPHLEHQLQRTPGLDARYCGSGTTNPDCVLDEQQRACGSAAAAHYALHSLAPSPTFNLVAFSETTKPVPPGQRLPDRFVLHVVHAETGTSLREPLPDVSGDLGWVMLDGGDGDGAAVTTTSSTQGSSRGGGRVYFTRAAQRELWCFDISPPPPSSSTSTSTSSAGAAGAADCSQIASLVPPTPMSEAPAVRVFRDPDGQPIQLVQYGSYLYGETLGNTGVPLEIRLLGLASAREVDGTQGFMWQRCSGRSVQDDRNGSDGPLLPLAAPRAPNAGVPLLPRSPGRQYSVLPLYLQVAIASAATSGSSGTGSGDGGSSSGSDGDDRDSSDRGIEMSRLDAHAKWQSISSCSESLLLWLRDLDHPNGCLMLVLIMEQGEGEEPRNRGPCDTCGCPRPRLLELLPHNPDLRIIHVDVHPGGEVRCIRENVDPRGDQNGQYELTELDLDLRAVRRAMADFGFDGGEGRDSLALQLAAAEDDSRSIGGGEVVHVDGCPFIRAASPLARVRRSRTLVVQGPRQHVLRVVAWGDDGQVTLSCSSLALPPVSVKIDLLPYTSHSCDSTKAIATVAMAPAVRRPVAELRLGVVDDEPRVITERLWATSADGVQVPITLCRVVLDTPKVSGQPMQGATRRTGGTDRYDLFCNGCQKLATLSHGGNLPFVRDGEVGALRSCERQRPDPGTLTTTSLLGGFFMKPQIQSPTQRAFNVGASVDAGAAAAPRVRCIRQRSPPGLSASVAAAVAPRCSGSGGARAWWRSAGPCVVRGRTRWYE